MSASSARSKSFSDSQGDSQISEISDFSQVNKNISLKLGGKGLKSLDFLNKFVREFPNVNEIDVANNKVGTKEMMKLFGELKKNKNITNINAKGNRVNRETKNFMLEELKKNKMIMDLQSPGLDDETIFNRKD